MKPSRELIFNFKNKTSQVLFKNLTTNTTDFSKCFENNLKFEEQAAEWKKVLNEYFHKAFKKVRLSNKNRVKRSDLKELMEKRNQLKNEMVPRKLLKMLKLKLQSFVRKRIRRK